MAIHPLIEQDKDYIISLRRWFHSHPELSMKEYHTAARIEEELSALGIPTRRVGETGVLGVLKGRKGPGRRVVLRADTDALPIQDEKAVLYASQCPGVMHACGHDAHTAALLGAARALKKLEDSFSGEVDLVFQPGEEYGAGAVLFVREGVLEGADRSFGVHMQSNLPVGQVAMNLGAENASVDHFTIRIHGRSAHVSTPELGADALYAAAQIVTALQGLVGRLKSPTDPALIGVGVLRAGEGYNIVAREAVIEGTVRCFSEETRAMINGKIADTARGVAALYNTTAEIETESFTRALINDAGVYAEAAPVIERVVGKGNLVAKELSLGGDDMAEIMAVVPGVYAFVGSGSEAVPGSRLAHHTPGFDVDEGALPIAASLYVESALFWLKQRT
ncbi:amidohydrolase [bacterium 1xD42-67]|nr:amidohydrolase [bacterium 1xD42-67]